MIRAFLRLVSWLIFCPHSDLIMERRNVDGIAVPHFICQSCGCIKPVIERTHMERQRIVALITPPAKATKDLRESRPAKVLPMGERTQAR